MKYRAVIFDLDGTLLNTIDDLGNAANRILTKHGWPNHSIDAYRYFVGDGAAMLIRRALPETQRDDSTIQSVLKEFRADYKLNCFTDTQPYEGIYSLLERLVKLGIKLAILSNKYHEETTSCVAYYFKAIDFAAVFGTGPDTPRKPDPEGALNIARLLDITPSEFLFLGDSSIDMNTAINAGMTPVGAAWGFRTEQELINAGAKKVIQHPEAFLDLVS